MDYQGKLKEYLEERSITIGDTIECVSDSETYKGILMPSDESSAPDIVVIKLSNGYNVGIQLNERTQIKLIKKEGEKSREGRIGVPHDETKPVISILHTGGTIASKVDYRTGAVSALFTAEDILSLFPEIRDLANIRSRLIRNMWSDDMRFSHYNAMAEEIRKEIERGTDGVIITHGTDTMAYTSAALAFILEDLPIPVILVGAQRSSDRGSSDAATNLISAVSFIVNSNFAEVAICMHHNSEDTYCSILPACKTRKMHTSRRDAFRPIGERPWARIDLESGKIIFSRNDYKKKDKARQLKVIPLKEDIKVGILRIRTHMYPEEFEFYQKNYFNGVILEGTGLGHTPLYVIPGDEVTNIHKDIHEALEKLIESGCVVVMTSQTLYGRINMNVYSKGRDLQKLGVLGNNTDMLPETAFIKLAWLLSNFSVEKAKKLIGENLRGEISERVKANTFLI